MSAFSLESVAQRTSDDVDHTHLEVSWIFERIHGGIYEKCFKDKGIYLPYSHGYN